MRRHERPFNQPPRAPGRSGLTLIEVLLATTIVVVVSLGVLLLGGREAFLMLQTTCTIAGIVFCWSLAYNANPDATRNVSALAVVAVLLFSTGTSWLLESREAARLTKARNNLRAIGMAMMDADATRFRTSQPVGLDSSENDPKEPLLDGAVPTRRDGNDD